MPVIATAGHVDHGKSTLIRALTGRDTDRLADEKRRGLTIDLGFAWTRVGDHDIGFVDVPGHERFLKNMLAGVEGIDGALLVVAADEGWMPQSEEHLGILDLLAVSTGVVALTRVDLVDADTVESVTLEIAERLEGTSLEHAPVLPVSAPAHLGMEALRSALGDLVAAPMDDGRPRMWIDRAFAIEGAGTVVTGTLTGGTVAVGDTVTIFPGGTQVRIRGLQNHETAVDRLGPGNRAAINVVGVHHGEVARGTMLGRGDQWRTTDRLIVDLRTVRSLDGPIRERGSFHVHAGSAAVPARIRLLEGDELVDRGAVLVSLEGPLPVAAGDRVILREVGRRSVVAGGVILDPAPTHRVRDIRPGLATLRAASDANGRAAALLEIRGIAPPEDLAADSRGGTVTAPVGGRAIASGQRTELVQQAVELATEFHRANPLRPGIGLATLAGRLALPVEVLDALVRESIELEVTGPDVRLAGFTDRLDEQSETVWNEVRERLLSAGPTPPRRKELDVDGELLHALVRQGALIEVSDDLLYLPEILERVVEATEAMPDGFTVAEFRDGLGMTRKHAVPLLEWLDREGITRRVGDGREVRRRRPDAPPPGGARSR